MPLCACTGTLRVCWRMRAYETPDIESVSSSRLSRVSLSFGIDATSYNICRVFSSKGGIGVPACPFVTRLIGLVQKSFLGEEIFGSPSFENSPDLKPILGE